MSANAQRLAEAVRARREELDLTQLDVWMVGGPSNTTQTEVENGRLERLTRTTARKLDHALQWEAGSARATWEGGNPTPLLAPGMSSSASRELREQIAAADLDAETREALLKVLDDRGEAG